jgi:signal transduction histidine kinase
MDSTEELIGRLMQHRVLAGTPRAELEWLVAHGSFKRYERGQYLARKGMSPEEAAWGMSIVLSGMFSITIDRGAGPKRVMEWQGGDLSGLMPFSRMKTSPGDTQADTDVETIAIDPADFPAMVRECPTVIEKVVHVMLDRARAFSNSDWQDEKMISLGKLAAGLAHELNNPASAVVRSAQLLEQGLAEAEGAARALGQAGLSERQFEAVDRVRICANQSGAASRSPLEQSDREDEIADWLAAHGADSSAVTALAESAITIEAMDRLASEIQGPALDAALDWVAAGCAVRQLANEIETAASRIHGLVAAVKGFTHMDRAQIAESVDLERGLLDTLTVLGGKARGKDVSLAIDLEPALPRVRAIGGELNQVWSNLVDNAIDAVPKGGSVRIRAERHSNNVLVRIIDDGGGIPADIQPRIFDPFFTTKEPGKGTGLGLDITRRLVRSIGGDISVTSVPGRTEFGVTLPVAE